MEIEAKFAVPDRTVYRRLARLRRLAGYQLVSAGMAQVADRYFDTAAGRLLAAGYACRSRVEGETVIATLKGLGGVEGAVHRRAEHEVRLAEWTPDAAAWPDSEARTLALELTAGALFQPLFALAQTRTRADALDGDRRVAQISVDAVAVQVGSRPARYYEIEAELTPDGTEADLARIAAELRDTWGLTPESRSKFARGLETWRAYRAALATRLNADERAVLAAHLADPDPLRARRAAVVLAWADGLPMREIAERNDLPLGRVRYWLRVFRTKRLGWWGADKATDEAADKRMGAPEEERTGEQGREGAGETPHAPRTTPHAPRTTHHAPRITHHVSRLPTVAQFAAQHGVDMAHAEYVAVNARLFFDALRPIHNLPRKRRRMLKQAALLNTVGATTDPEHPYAAGRDLILAQPLRDVGTGDRLALACIVAFNRGKVRPEREPTMTAVDEKLRPHVLALVAVLRVAEALDFSATQSTEILGMDNADSPVCEIPVVGPSAEVDALQAITQADLWHRLFKQELIFLPPEREPLPAPAATPASPTAAVAEPVQPVPPAIPPIQPDEPMSEAGRKVLYLHFAKMLANEAGTRLGENIEALHDMRVATRRMRAASQLFAPHFDADHLRPLEKGLRRTGRTLGAVRDLDVLLDKARAYAATLPPELAPTFEPLLVEWETRREIARRQMLEYLDGRAYRQFATGFQAFVATPGAGALPLPPGAPVPYQVRHIVPRLILAHYEAVRAFETVIPGAPLPTMHALRIECKGLRYALEFFRDVLGPGTPDLIKQVVTLQDLLGELQDACVAEGLLAEFLAGQPNQGQKRDQAISLAGVEAYLAAQQTQQADLLARFPAPWADLTGPDFRRSLALALAAL
ncbi:MAG: CHAD domain-containing protein [Chloroflexi bacterium]|nr:CHAD domain-containing protein [Chloroflexota bacterium]